eukprot:SAG11_NODE_40657_length_199_cov_247.970000_1_plen_33_part_01
MHCSRELVNYLRRRLLDKLIILGIGISLREQVY